MSVLAEAISVIVPVAVVTRKYPGGLEAYERDCPNGTFCRDDYLTRIGFMDPADVRSFITRLESFGFIYVNGNEAIDLVVVDQLQGPVIACKWIEGGTHKDGYSAVWWAGTVPGWFRHPKNWTPSQSSQLHFTSAEERRERFLDLGTTKQVEVLLDFKTGREVFIGRTESKD